MDASMNSQALLGKLESLVIGSADAELDFTARLARENDWSRDFAEKVIRKYKRFLYMVATAGRQLTPSDEVDQAWHLHLVYTHSYWHELCRDILGFELHHQPTRGGASEQGRFRDQYQLTLDYYREVFGEAPPADVWPDVGKRFENVSHFVRVNRARAWLVRKPRHLGRAAAVMMLAAMLPACIDAEKDSGLLIFFKLVIGLISIVYLLKFLSWISGGKGGRGSGGDAGCSGCAGCGGD